MMFSMFFQDIIGSILGGGTSGSKPSILTPSERAERKQAKFIIPIAGEILVLFKNTHTLILM